MEKISLRKIEKHETTSILNWYFLLSQDYAMGMGFLLEMLGQVIMGLFMTISGVAQGLGNLRLFTIGGMGGGGGPFE